MIELYYWALLVQIFSKRNEYILVDGPSLCGVGFPPRVDTPYRQTPIIHIFSLACSLRTIMNPLFCCSSISPYRPQRLLHESKFTDFMSWSRGIDSAAAVADDSPDTMDNTTYVIQLVQQVNYGPLESKKYFARTTATQQDAAKFLEVSENDLIAANFKKLNA